MKQLLPDVVHTSSLEKKMSRPDKRARDELKIDSRHSDRSPFKHAQTINDSPRSAIQFDESNPLYLLKQRSGILKARHNSVLPKYAMVADASRKFNSPSQFNPVKRDLIFQGSDATTITERANLPHLLSGRTSVPRLRAGDSPSKASEVSHFRKIQSAKRNMISHRRFANSGRGKLQAAEMLQQ